MDPRLRVGLIAALLVAPAATASHAPGSVPLRTGDPTVDDARAWLAANVGPDGCYRQDGACRPGATKWAAFTLASAGVDPAAWPEPDRSPIDWMLAHAGDLRDTELKRCDGIGSNPDVCRARRVYSLAKAILAFRAAGHEPRSIPRPDGGTRNLVAELRGNFTADQFGSPSYYNDDIWAVLVLTGVRADGPKLRDALDEIAGAQRSNGGVPWSRTAGQASIDTTAVATMAMAPHDRPAFVDEALGYLADTRIAEGRHAGCWPRTPDSSATAGSTAWAIQAVVAAGHDPWAWRAAGPAPTTCLAAFQRPGGSFANSHGEGMNGPSFQATVQAVAALTWAPYGRVRSPAIDVHRTVAMTRSGRTVAVDDGALRLGGTTRSQLELAYDAPRMLTYHGVRFGDPPQPVTIDVLPGPPQQPGLEAPERVSHDQLLTIRAEPAGPWTNRTRIALPGGAEVRGPTARIRVPEPGEATIRAWATNAIGETSLPVEATVTVTNRPPRIEAFDVPRTVRPGANASVHAAVADPDDATVNVTWRLDHRVVAEGRNASLTVRRTGLHRVEVVAADPWGGTATRTGRLRVTEPSSSPTRPDVVEPVRRSRAADPTPAPGRAVPGLGAITALAALAVAGRARR